MAGEHGADYESGLMKPVEVWTLPKNKIGQLKPGQGLRRIQAQRQGGWVGDEAKLNYEIGAEFRPEEGARNLPTQNARGRGMDRT